MFTLFLKLPFQELGLLTSTCHVMPNIYSIIADVFLSFQKFISNFLGHHKQFHLLIFLPLSLFPLKSVLDSFLSHLSLDHLNHSY